MAQNSNPGSIWAYSFFRPVLVTGLIEALLTQYFQILAIRAGNPKSPMLRGGKPALLFPIGWQIDVQMGWSRGKGKRRAVLGIGNSLYKQKRKHALVPAPLLRRRSSSHEGFPTPKIALIREKTALMFWDIPAPWPVWLSGAFSQRKITANSTYWEAKLR
jgi:hypothetical protein